MATYAVGDIQGCYDSLRKLLDKAKFDPSTDKLWALGDLINRGPKDYEVLKFCISLGDSFNAVLGNHDLHFLAIALGYHEARATDTFGKVLKAPDLDEILTWLRHRPLAHYDKKRNMLMVHAGVPPQWSAKQTIKLAQEVEHAIIDEQQSRLYFANMYGNHPKIWKKDLSGVKRWRIITNYLTRMRFCDPKGRLDLKSKAGTDQAPEGYIPWFQTPNRKTADTNLLFGHWAALMGETTHPNTYALDTGCVWGGQMTLVNIDKLKKRISVNCVEK